MKWDYEASSHRLKSVSKKSAGQILLPTLFVLPSLLLILFFLIEVWKLSREKIRNQFALDISATLEMEQYTDLLNRMAYINGVFPERIFKDAYGPAWAEYYNNGLFPGSLEASMSPGAKQWPIQFGPGRAYANVADPPLDFGILHMHVPGGTVLPIDEATRRSASYILVYKYLGDLAAKHKQTFNEVTQSQHALLRKSMWLNLTLAGGNRPCNLVGDCGEEAADGFKTMQIRFHHVSGFKHCPTLIIINGVPYEGEIGGPFDFGGSGLFQLATIPQEDLEQMRRGFLIQQHWKPPSNFFAVDLDALEPYVRATVTSSGGKVWPSTTPKYSTRLYP